MTIELKDRSSPPAAHSCGCSALWNRALRSVSSELEWVPACTDICVFIEADRLKINWKEIKNTERLLDGQHRNNTKNDLSVGATKDTKWR